MKQQMKDNKQIETVSFHQSEKYERISRLNYEN